MLAVRRPALCSMSPTAAPYVPNHWSSWRTTSGDVSDLPTPPSSVPQRYSKMQLPQPQAAPIVHALHHQHFTLPPIEQLDQHWSRRHSPCMPSTMSYALRLGLTSRSGHCLRSDTSGRCRLIISTVASLKSRPLDAHFPCTTSFMP